MVLRATAESALIKCRECGFVFSEDEAEVCRRCHQYICPKCGVCGCFKGDMAFHGRYA